MRLSSLCLVAVLVCSSAAFAQHSSGGGGSSGGSGGSSGGGSHSSSSGGSSGGGSHSSYSGGSGSSASSHSSGGSVSRGGSVSHGSSVRASSSGTTSFRSDMRESPSNTLHSIREPNAGVRTKSEASGKKSFFSFLRHPFRKPESKPKPVADLRRRICFKGPCPVCPTGQVGVRGGCVGIPVPNHRHNFCSQGEIWNGGACLLQTRFLDDCSSLRLAMDRQAQRIHAAEAAQQSACSTGPSQQCSDLSSTAQSESSLYRSWQDRYNRCQRRSMIAYPFGGGIWSYSAGLLFDRLEMDWEYP